MPRVKYSKEMLEPIITRCKTITEVLIELGLAPTGGNFGTIRRKIASYNLDASHFVKESWSKGLTKETSEVLAKRGKSITKHTPDTAFKENTRLSSSTLKKLFDELDVPEICTECGIGNTWNGKPIRLQIDHVNGIRTDNRITNLRYLCPNCHSQTDTFAGRNLVPLVGFEPTIP